MCQAVRTHHDAARRNDADRHGAQSLANVYSASGDDRQHTPGKQPGNHQENGQAQP
ncbi:hypothetical protein BOSP111201_21345 [Bordetella sputigena]